MAFWFGVLAWRCIAHRLGNNTPRKVQHGFVIGEVGHKLLGPYRNLLVIAVSYCWLFIAKFNKVPRSHITSRSSGRYGTPVQNLQSRSSRLNPTRICKLRRSASRPLAKHNVWFVACVDEPAQSESMGGPWPPYSEDVRVPIALRQPVLPAARVKMLAL